MTSEFALIDYFRQNNVSEDVKIGIGDDGAVLAVTEPCLAHCTVCWQYDRDFQFDGPGDVVGCRLLASALAQLSTQGFQPRWATLSVGIPAQEIDWLQAFSRGLLDALARHQISLVGGDTTRSDGSLILQLTGSAPQAPAPATGRSGHSIFVIGTPGDAGLGLLALQGELQLPKHDRAAAMGAFETPQVPVRLNYLLRRQAVTVIALHQGLLPDLAKRLCSEGLGAELTLEQIPLSVAQQTHFDMSGGWTLPLYSEALHACVCIADGDQQPQIERLAEQAALPCHWLGTVTKKPGIRVRQADGSDYTQQECES